MWSALHLHSSFRPCEVRLISLAMQFSCAADIVQMKAGRNLEHSNDIDKMKFEFGMSELGIR